MNSKIIISENIEDLKEKVNGFLKEVGLTNPHADLLYLDQEKLGIKETQAVRNFLSVKPFSAKGRGVVILNAQNLSLDAQNSLLKTLEEPPLESIILLGTNNENNLLPTILSRCEVFRLDNTSDKEGVKHLNNIENLETMDIDGRFAIVEKAEDKEQFLKELILFYRAKLKENPKYLEFTKELLEAEKWAKQNVNLRAILEYLMLNLP